MTKVTGGWMVACVIGLAGPTFTLGPYAAIKPVITWRRKMGFLKPSSCASAFGLFRNRARAAFMIAGVALAAASPASATSYYTAGVFGSIDGNSFGQGSTQTVPQTQSLFGGNGWSAIATSNDDNGGTVTADVGVPPNWGYNTSSNLQHISASSSLSYDFSLVGADPNALIKVLVSGVGHATQSDPNLGGYASATFQLGGPAGSLLNYTIDTIGLQGTTTGGAFTVDDFVYLRVGTTYHLSLSAYVKGRSDERFDELSMPDGKYANFSAGVDPLFTILGSDASAYHFVGLPDSAIGGSAAVPEPASWAMMAIGLGLIGGQMRRRQRVKLAGA